MKQLPPDKHLEQDLEFTEQGYVRLPFNKDEFKEFVVGLLGRPQNTSGVLEGPFEIDFSNIRNLYELLTQRISQQNDANLLQFQAFIIYSDSTSDSFNSIEELMTFNQFRPVVAECLYLTFHYLVKFNDKKLPEKQTIEISFVGFGQVFDENNKRYKTHEDLLIMSFISKKFNLESDGYVQYSINHTARTWGEDINALLANYFKTLVNKESPSRILLKKHKGKITTSVLVLSIFIGGYAGNIAKNNQLNQRKIDIERLFTNSNIDIKSLSEQIRFLAEKGFIDQSIPITIGLFIGLIIGMISVTVSHNIFTFPKVSHLLLTKESIAQKELLNQKYNKQFSNFILSIIVSIICSLIANYIFLYLCS